MTRWECETNESVYERPSIGTCAEGVKCGVVKWLKGNTLWWFGHIQRMKSRVREKKCMSRVLVGKEGHLEDGRIG